MTDEEIRKRAVRLLSLAEWAHALVRVARVARFLLVALAIFTVMDSTPTGAFLAALVLYGLIVGGCHAFDRYLARYMQRLERDAAKHFGVGTY